MGLGRLLEGVVKRAKKDHDTDSTAEVAPVAEIGYSAASKDTIAIFGASGHLGKHITKAFLTQDIRHKFKDIILFTRPSSKQPPEFESWQKDGSVIVQTIASDTHELRDQLSTVDVVVNCINSEGNNLRTQIVQAIAGTNVKLYFPSEFGVDHTIHDFNHPEWDKKKAHFELAKNILKNTTICRVYAGLFLEDSIGPWFGFDTKNKQYECYGSSDSQATYTSLDDVGRIVAELCLISPSEIPSQLHFCGDIVSMKQVANLMRNKSGDEIMTVQRSLQENKAKELKQARPDPSGCLRFLMGEGRIQHTAESLGCDNELVNPNQSKWKWKTMADLAEETGGRPWVDATWS